VDLLVYRLIRKWPVGPLINVVNSDDKNSLIPSRGIII
jgi:hypothetical protein